MTLPLIAAAGFAFVLWRRPPAGPAAPATAPVPAPASGGISASTALEGPVSPAFVSTPTPEVSGSKTPAAAARPADHASAWVRVYRDTRRKLADRRALVQKLEARLKDKSLSEADRRVLEAELAEREREFQEADAELNEIGRRARAWSSENPGHAPVLYDEMQAAGVEGAGRYLAGHSGNADLEKRVLRDLTPEGPSARLALEVAEAAPTPARVGSVMAIARGDSRDAVRALATRVLTVYKDAPDAITYRTSIFQSLVDVAKSPGAPEVRCQALMGLGRERTPGEGLLAMVRDLSTSDPAAEVRSAAGQVLRRWESR